MKTKHFLFALALPAVFAACNNDEFSAIEPNENAGMEAVKGYALLSNGLSINVANGTADTRMENGEFTSTDRLGLGWVLSAAVGNPQLETGTQSDSKLYANHLFAQDATGKFTTTGNVYEGWHFAYYPYTYMPKVAQLVIDNVNPAQKKDWATDRYESALYVSAQHFLSGDDVVDSQLDADREVFKVKKMVNELDVRIKPSTDFTESEILSKLHIKDITLTANNQTDKPFFTKATFSPRYLPVAQYDKKGNPDLEATEKLMTVEGIFGSSKKAIKKEGETAALKTVVEGEQYDLSDVQTLRMFTLPTKEATVALNQIAIRINVEGGYFNVKYTTKNPTDAQKNNNEKIEKIANLLSPEGYKKDGATFKLSDFCQAQRITLELTKDMFTADYRHIANFKEWEVCVNIANALGEKDVIFNATGAVEFPEGDMLVPDAKTTVTTSSKGVLSFAEETNWNKNLACGTTSKVVVAKDGVLNVEGKLLASEIVNNGRINAGAEASISNATAKSLTNNGEIFVEYGAYVYPATGAEGVIAYEVTDADRETIGKINTLIATKDNREFANVNTLVVSNTELNLRMPSSQADNDRYNPSSATSLSSLEDIDIRLDNGSVVYTTGSKKTVKSVKAIAGDNTIYDIKVAENVTVDEGAKLTVDGKVIDNKGNKNPLDMTGDIINAGTLNVATNINCGNVDNAKGHIITDIYQVTYSGKYIQGGTVEGNVNQKPEAPKPDADGKLAKAVVEKIAAIRDYTDNSNTKGFKTYQAVVKNIQDNDTDYQNNAITALNAWRKAYDYSEVTRVTVTIKDLMSFEFESGESLGLTETEE